VTRKAVGVVPRIGRPRSQGSISVRDIFSLKQSNHFFPLADLGMGIALVTRRYVRYGHAFYVLHIYCSPHLAPHCCHLLAGKELKGK
jgi:hypothetical protein